MHRAVLLLKPEVFKQKNVGAALSWAESMAELVDIFAHDTTAEEVQSFFVDGLGEFANQAEVASFLGGPLLVVGLARDTGFREMKRRFEGKYACRLFEGAKPISFWFGLGKMAHED